MNYKNNIAILLLFAVSNYAIADVTNGSFETWSAGSPTGWSTIDSGISVNQNTSIFQEGTSSAAITVNTSTQGSTDFRQVLSVVSGQTYDFSVGIYHTEGGVKARLYIDGYQDYSNESLVNQWQQVTHRYVANSTKDISVGLRFYDAAGFDGAEIVYVDYFQPTQASGGGTGGDSCSTNEIAFSLTTDTYGYETSWTITNTSDQEVANGGSYANATDYNENFCLDDGDYTFTINDSYGDGICCSYGNGSYVLTNITSGATLASGGSFTNTDTTPFCIGTSARFLSNKDDIQNQSPQEIAAIHIYPNPVIGNTIRFLSSEVFDAIHYDIVNAYGTIIQNGVINESKISLQNIPEGIYVLRLNYGKKLMVKKFIKE